MGGIHIDRPIFDEPPDDLGEHEFEFGHLLISGFTADTIEIAWAFRAAGDRLLEAAADSRESWEAAYPILFCYRHALEVNLKAVTPGISKGHDLKTLWERVRDSIKDRYPTDQIGLLGDPIMEFHDIGPRSTRPREPSAASADAPGPRGNSTEWGLMRQLFVRAI